MLRIIRFYQFKVKACYGYHVKCGRLSVFQGWPYIVSNVIARLSHYVANNSVLPIKVKACYGYHVKCGRLSVFQ